MNIQNTQRIERRTSFKRFKIIFALILSFTIAKQRIVSAERKNSFAGTKALRRRFSKRSYGIFRALARKNWFTSIYSFLIFVNRDSSDFVNWRKKKKRRHCCVNEILFYVRRKFGSSTKSFAPDSRAVWRPLNKRVQKKKKNRANFKNSYFFFFSFLQIECSKLNGK